MGGLAVIGGLVFLLFAGNVIDYYKDKNRLRQQCAEKKDPRTFAARYREATLDRPLHPLTVDAEGNYHLPKIITDNRIRDNVVPIREE